MNLVPLTSSSQRPYGLHAGLKYQYLTTMAVWLRLADGQKIFVEGANDIDLITKEAATSVDTHLRGQGDRLTLRDKKVLTALANAYRILIKENQGRNATFGLVTNAEVGVEQGEPFGRSVGGLIAWSEAKRGDELLRKSIIQFLVTSSDLPAEVIAFLNRHKPDQVWDTYLGKVWFDSSAHCLQTIESEVDQLLQVQFGNREFDIQNLKKALYWHICRLSASKEVEELNLESLQSLIRRATIPTQAWAQITHRSFIPFTCWMDEIAATGFSRNAFFENRLVENSPDDERVISQVLKQLMRPGAIVSLRGPTASGKSMIAAEIGRKLEFLQFSVYVQSVSYQDASNSLEIQIAGLDADQELQLRPRVLILDNCHQQPTLLRSIWNQRTKWRNTSFLAISVDTDTSINELDDRRDVTEEFPGEARVVMPSVETPLFRRKIDRLIDRFKAFHCRQDLRSLRVGNLKRITELAQVSMVAFIEAALSWDESIDLSTLAQSSAQRVFGPRYLQNVSAKAKELLLQIACVAEWEEAVCCIPDPLADAGRELRERGIIHQVDANTQTGVRFPHPQIASLLVAAHVSQYPEETSEVWKLKQIQEYVVRSDRFGVAIPSLLMALGLHRKSKAIEHLLGDNQVTMLLIEAFLCRPVGESIDFLFVGRRLLSRRTLTDLLERLVWNRQNAPASLKNDGSPVLLLKRLFSLASLGGSADLEHFDRFATGAVVTASVAASDFHSISVFIWTVNERRRPLVGRWLHELSINEFAILAGRASVTELIQGFGRLGDVSMELPRQILGQILKNDSSVIQNLLSLRFDHFADAISLLNRVDEISVRRILSLITPDLLKRMTEQCTIQGIAIAFSQIKDVNKHLAAELLAKVNSFGNCRGLPRFDLNTAGNTLAELARVDAKTARKLLDKFSPAEMAIWGRRAPLVQLGKTFAELSKVNHRVVRVAFGMIDWPFLVRKVRECKELKTITKALNELHKVDRHIAEALMDVIDLDELVRMCRQATAEALGRSLRELGALSPTLPRKICAELLPESYAASLLEAGIVQCGHSLAEIAKVAPEFASEIEARLPIDKLAKAARAEQRFLSLCSVFSMLPSDSAVNKNVALELLEELGPEHFAKMATSRRSRFEEIGLGLGRLMSLDTKTAKLVLDRCNIGMLVAKGRKEQVGKTCRAIGAISKVDMDIAKLLANSLVDGRFCELLTAVQPVSLVECLHVLTPVYPNIANAVLARFDPESFENLFRTTPSSSRIRFIRQFQVLAPEIVKKLHQEPVSNIAKKKRRKRDW